MMRPASVVVLLPALGRRLVVLVEQLFDRPRLGAAARRGRRAEQFALLRPADLLQRVEALEDEVGQRRALGLRIADLAAERGSRPVESADRVDDAKQGGRR